MIITIINGITINISIMKIIYHLSPKGTNVYIKRIYLLLHSEPNSNTTEKRGITEHFTKNL